MLRPLGSDASSAVVRDHGGSDQVGWTENQVTTVTTYTQARAELAALCDEVASTREPVIIRRRNAEDVALVSADELASLLEIAHLLRSPKKRPTPSRGY